MNLGGLFLVHKNPRSECPWIVNKLNITPYLELVKLNKEKDKMKYLAILFK